MKPHAASTIAVPAAALASRSPWNQLRRRWVEFMVGRPEDRLIAGLWSADEGRRALYLGLLGLLVLPVIVGLGIGGTADKATLIAKKALFRTIGQHHSNKDIAKMERDLLKMLNESGVGPSGLGGNTTALAANIETFPSHIASLPVAVAIDCHAHRIKKAKI